MQNDSRTYGKTMKIPFGQENDCTTGCLLHYNYFKNYYRLIAKDLGKQQVLNGEPSATQQINFIGNLYWVVNTVMFFIIAEAKETILDFSQGTVKVL